MRDGYHSFADEHSKDSGRSVAVQPEVPSSAKPAAVEHAGGEALPSLDKVRRPHIVWVLLVLMAGCCVAGGMFFLGWMPLEKRHSALEKEAEEVKTAQPKVSVVTPKRAAGTNEIVLPGEIQAVRETAIYARTSGYLKKWFFDIGDHVDVKQTLAEIDSPEIDMQLLHAQAMQQQAEASVIQSKAALEQSKAQLVNAQSSEELAALTMKRYEGVRGKDIVSELEISEKEAALKVAKAVTVAAKAAIGAAEANINASLANVNAAKAEVRRLDVLKSFEQVTAPFEGTITARTTEVGSLVTQGSGAGAQPLFHIAATNPVRIYIDVPQAYAPAIKDGQVVNLFVREFPNAKYTGEITRTSRSIEQSSRTLRAEVQIPNASGELLNGMYAQVKLSVVRPTPPLVLPNSALIVNAQGTQVALVRDGRVHFQPIVIEGDYGATFGVSAGLSDDDKVIANPSERLTEGLPVQVVSAAQ
jgi:RND family efflux transporter MFP subunit